MTISGELSTLIPVLFPCATAAPLKNDTGTGIGFPHGGRGPTAAVRDRCFRILLPLDPPADPTTECFAGACCRWIPQRTQRRNALPEPVAVGSPSGPNDGMLCRSLLPLGPPADPTTECFAGACEVVESPSGPNGVAPSSRDLAEAGRLTAGVPCSAARVCGAPADQQVRMAQVAAPRALTTSVPRLKRRKRQKGCRNTGSGRWRPLGDLLNDCWRAPKGSPIGRALWRAETAN